jgi:phosphoribosyl 1,2-cyclic phosphodiesterase
MDLCFLSLSSGSSGNSYYLGSANTGILIDAGISATSVRKHLKSFGIGIEAIAGIIVTPNHTDHIRGLAVLTRRYSLPAFTSERVRRSILGSCKKISAASVREIRLRSSFRLAGFEIEAFPVCHDAPETIGFHICAGSRKITIATDLGHICETAAFYIRAANLLVLESNYDRQMLDEGPYPFFLKARIKSDHGHLDNRQASSFVAEMANENLKTVCLAHLSKNNNTPEKALKTLHDTFSEKGIMPANRPCIRVLQRDVPTEILNEIGNQPRLPLFAEERFLRLTD